MENGDWIALAALAVALWVGIAHYRLQKTSGKRQQEIQERLAAIEEARRHEELANRSAALIVCEKRKDPTSSGRLATWIVFRNDGSAVARDVWFEREPVARLITSDEEANFPRLAPGQEWKILADPTMDDPPRITFDYGWTDKAGAHTERMVYPVFS